MEEDTRLLPREARWLARAIEEIGPDRAFPLCDVGAAPDEFRSRTQPHVDRILFGPLREAGHRIVTVDRSAGPGVDVCGDVSDPRVRETLVRMSFRSVLCANVLEHVSHPASFARDLLGLLPEGGHLLVTCPRRYPYHPDPIDTGFRPAPDDLAALFPGAAVVKSEVLDCGTAWANRDWLALGRKALRLMVPIWRPRGWWSTVSFAPYLVRPFEVTCMLLRVSSTMSR